MKRNFKKSLTHVLVHEGGWADHPRDPGGATMKGVTLATFRRYFGADKSKTALRKISDKDLSHVYRDGYWNKCSCDELPGGVDYAVFDAAVNSGPGRSAKWLQAAVGAKQDASIGAKTIDRVKEQDSIKIIDAMCDHRLSFLQSLDTWSAFGKGWGRRVEGVRATAITMTDGTRELSEPITPAVNFRTAKRGSKGEWVRKLQEALGLQVNGKFGKDTETALKAWQEEQGLEPDGIAGRLTFRALGLIA